MSDKYKNFILYQDNDVILVYMNDKYRIGEARGKYYQMLCPFHDEKTSSFQMARNKAYFHCFGCGISGHIVGNYDDDEINYQIVYRPEIIYRPSVL